MTRPRPQPPCTPGRPVAAACGDGDAVRATAARLERGYLRVSTETGVELLRGPAWLSAAGDGRGPIDVLLRPCGTAVTVTWRDGSRRRFDVSWLHAGARDGRRPASHPAASHPAASHPAGSRRGTDAAAEVAPAVAQTS